MKKLYSLLFLSGAVFFGYAQVGTGFEECFGGTSDYTDPDFSTTHQLPDNANPQPTVNHTYSGGELGFTTTFTPSRTGTPGTTGLSDGDAVGVLSNAYTISSTDVASWNSGNAYVIEDSDGMITVTFDVVDLSGTTNPHFQMDLWVDQTTYESSNGSNDRVYIRLEIDGGASTVDVLDSDGGGSGGGGGVDLDDVYIYPGTGTDIVEVITPIDVDLSAHVGSTVQLIIEGDFDSGSEKIIFDNIQFTEGNIVTLPVELTTFNAKIIENKAVLLNWETKSEINNDHFRIERSIDGKTWEKLATVKGAGNSTSASNYEALDNKPLAGTSYYRLIQTDLDGTTRNLKIVAVEIQKNTNIPYTVYPNPSKNEFNIQFPIELVGEKTTIEILNNIGKIVYSETFIASTIKSFQFNGASGLYLMNIKSKDGKILTIQKLLKE